MSSQLTDRQIEKGWRDTFSTSNPFCPCDLRTFTKVARWAERHLSDSLLAQSRWRAAKPTQPGAYWIRGNGLERDALIEVVFEEGELWCNLHDRTTAADFRFGYTVEQLSSEFEWVGPLGRPMP